MPVRACTHVAWQLDNEEVAANGEVLMLYVIVQQLQAELAYKDDRIDTLEEWIGSVIFSLTQ